jgi:hypothetical protein
VVVIWASTFQNINTLSPALSTFQVHRFIKIGVLHIQVTRYIVAGLSMGMLTSDLKSVRCYTTGSYWHGRWIHVHDVRRCLLLLVTRTLSKKFTTIYFYKLNSKSQDQRTKSEKEVNYCHYHQTVHTMHRHSRRSFRTYNGAKRCQSVLETAVIRVPARTFVTFLCSVASAVIAFSWMCFCC